MEKRNYWDIKLLRYFTASSSVVLAYKNQGIIPCKDNEIKEFPFVITWVEKYSKIKTSLKMFLQAENKYHSIKVKKKKKAHKKIKTICET